MMRKSLPPFIPWDLPCSLSLVPFLCLVPCTLCLSFVNCARIMKTFNVPIIYRSPLITAIKQKRKLEDRMKKDFTPALLDFGPIQIYLARHFGFCYGVENAIEIAFRTIE